MTEPQPWPDRSWVSTDELAAIAGVVERTILREINRGHLQAHRHGAWIIERADAETWLAGYRQRNPTGTE